jgi:hypothetical protein
MDKVQKNNFTHYNAPSFETFKLSSMIYFAGPLYLISLQSQLTTKMFVALANRCVNTRISVSSNSDTRFKRDKRDLDEWHGKSHDLSNAWKFDEIPECGHRWLLFISIAGKADMY